MSLQWQVAMQQQEGGNLAMLQESRNMTLLQEGRDLALLNCAPHHQVMEELLEEWCVSGGHPYDLDVTSLSVALEQARLKYHAQVCYNENMAKCGLKSHSLF